MREPSTHPARRRLYRIGAAFAVATGLLAIYSCSLIVEQSSTQCMSNTDCTPLNPMSTCDLATNTCILPAGTSSSSGSTSTSSSSSSSSSSSGSGCNVDGGIDGGGCYSATCTPATYGEFLNTCETGCTPYNNALVTKLLPGAALPSLPSPGPVEGPDGGF